MRATVPSRNSLETLQLYMETLLPSVATFRVTRRRYSFLRKLTSFSRNFTASMNARQLSPQDFWSNGRFNVPLRASKAGSFWKCGSGKPGFLESRPS